MDSIFNNTDIFPYKPTITFSHEKIISILRPYIFKKQLYTVMDTLVYHCNMSVPVPQDSKSEKIIFKWINHNKHKTLHVKYFQTQQISAF